MPGLTKSHSLGRLGAYYGDQQADVTSPLLPTESSGLANMANTIRYIPPQMDPLAGSSTKAARQSPLRLLIQDVGVLITMLPYLPYIFLPVKTKDPSSECYPSLEGVRDILVQGWLFIMEASLLLISPFVLLVLPGTLSVLAIAMCYLTVYLVTWPLEGPDVTYSDMDEITEALAEQHRDERWLFINGTATGHAGLQKNIDRISKTFGRAVIGIHNKTYGLPADLLECLVQRCFSYKTKDVRIAYSYVKAVLLEPTVKKVVLIGHSQGGLIASLVLDELFSELPTSCMSKLEIYTFGSAASHFSNPLISLPIEARKPISQIPPSAVHFDLPPQPKRVISHIEHYANEKDMVPRWGVLHCVQDILDNRYAGSVFVRMGASGHLFNQHYMDAMFPLGGPDTVWQPSSFLDQQVKVDKKLAMKKENVAISKFGVMRRESGLEFGNGQVIHDGAGVINGHTDNTVMAFGRTKSGQVLSEEAQGKTVRELSRLWRYEGGRSPHTPTPCPTRGGQAQRSDERNDNPEPEKDLNGKSGKDNYPNTR